MEGREGKRPYITPKGEKNRERGVAKKGERKL